MISTVDGDTANYRCITCGLYYDSIDAKRLCINEKCHRICAHCGNAVFPISGRKPPEKIMTARYQTHTGVWDKQRCL